MLMLILILIQFNRHICDQAARQDGGAIDHSRVRALFDEFDDDSNGYLDAEEVRAFSATLGLALSA